jgi:hypothetical protein
MIFPTPRREDVDRTVTLPDGEVTQLPANSLVDKARLLIDLKAQNGPDVHVWVVPRAGDPPCYVHSRGRACLHPRLEPHPLGAGVHGGSKQVLIAGLVRSDVATYELHFENGDIDLVEPVEGFVLYEIPTEHFARGHRLELIQALDRNGVVLAEQAVRTDAFGVYPCEKPVDVGHGVTACP